MDDGERSTELLEGARALFVLTTDPMAALLRRRERRRRSRRVGSAVVALALAAGAIGLLTRAFRPAATIPANPSHTNVGNGVIVTGPNGAEFDPTTGRQVGNLHLGVPGFKLDESDGASWSPDGSQLIYSARQIPGAIDGGLYLYETSTGKSRRVIPCEAGFLCHPAPAWAPDGSVIAAYTQEHIELIDPKTWRIATIGEFPNQAIDATWSPDSRRLAFWQNSGWFAVIDRDGGGYRRLVRGSPTLGATWNPDGNRILIGSLSEGAVHIMSVSPHGGAPTALLTFRCACRGANSFDMTWSPDGTKLAIVISSRGARSPGMGLYVADADGSNLRHLNNTAYGFVAWRPVPRP
jgi:Tol biopolymer transport system component